ncbi:MAG: rhomboid family intramembrane serine protease [Planctomycetaceae bacterium]
MSRFRACPRCRALVEPGPRACPYCGAAPAPAPAAPRRDAERTLSLAYGFLGLLLALYLATVARDPYREPGFAAWFDGPSSAALLRFGGLERERILQSGEAWRLLAAIFLHGGAIHLFFNAFALVILFPVTALTLGFARTASILVAGGGLASATNCAVIDPGRVGIGASGAVCALIGALFAAGRRRRDAEGRMMAQRMLLYAAVILLYGVSANRLGGSAAIDNAAHLGGLAAGAGLGWLASAASPRGGRADQIWLGAGVSAVGLALAALGFVVVRLIA